MVDFILKHSSFLNLYELLKVTSCASITFLMQSNKQSRAFICLITIIILNHAKDWKDYLLNIVLALIELKD